MTDFFIPAEFDFGQQFDRPTLTRAMALDPERAVLSMQIDGPALVTRLRGSGVQIYEQRTELPVDRRLGLGVRGQCTCPVGSNCKHVAAALMAFEAFQIRRAKNPDAALPVALMPRRAAPAEPAPSASGRTVGPTGAPSPASGPALSPSAVPGALPPALLHWLGELAVAPLGTGVPAAAGDTAPPARQLMYALRVDGPRLEVQIVLAALRRSGEIGSLRRHASPPENMLRQLPSYLREADMPVLAALLAMPPGNLSGTLGLFGRGAAALLPALLRTGRAWLPADIGTLPAPPVEPAAWRDAAITLALRWHADAAGLWRSRWEGAAPGEAEPRALQLVLLPEPHAVDAGAATLQPAAFDGAPLPDAVAGWLARMPAVAADALPAFVERLQTLAAARHIAVPLPPEHARDVRTLGRLPLEPVLRLGTCVDSVAEALSGDGLGLPGSRRGALRQASIEFRLRYRPPGAAPVEFHFPAGAAATAFVEARDGAALLSFERDAETEVAALRTLFETLDLRPWSVAAGLAFDRLERLQTGRLQASALPASVAGKPLVLLPRRRDQWLDLLARRLPALEHAGWTVEQDGDFPFETHAADDWHVDVAERPGHDWFDVGLEVHVEGEVVNLVPLLVGLVQGGWLTPEASGDAGDTGTAPGDVLLPWPDATAPGPGGMPRQRLLRLPRERVAPLLDWLRSAFRVGDKNAALRLSRFDFGAALALASVGGGTKLAAPPSFVELTRQMATLRGQHQLPAVTPSPQVLATLRHYQQDGLAWMDFMRRARLGGVLADDMGLGKTLQTLALLQGELDAGRLDRPSLVIVPTSLLGNWQSEAERFTPALRLLVLHGPQRTPRFDHIAAAHVVITSYPLAVRDFHVLSVHEWHYLVLDEAQRIKNSRSQAALTLKGLRARHRLALSGTPLENHLGELWSLIDFVCPGLLGSETQFRELYRNPIEKRHDGLAADRLARRVRPFILRRTKSQVARELPEKTETLLRVELAGAQADLYETVRATMDQKLREAIARQGLAKSQIMVLEALLKLRQVCCDPRLLKTGPPARGASSAKMELLLDLLPTLVEDGRRVLLFSQFTEMLALIEPELARLGLPYLKLTGESNDRAAIVAEFQHGNAPLFLVSLKAGGVGLNLTAADTVILYDPWWNPAVEQQAVDRAYRIGQDKPVFVYKLVASGTVEDKMLELQARKAGLADLLLSGVAADAALSPQDFDELFKPLGGA